MSLFEFHSAMRGFQKFHSSSEDDTVKPPTDEAYYAAMAKYG